MNLDIETATAKPKDAPYRNLWAEVIRHAYHRALVGESGAIVFFTARKGRFSELCVLLDWDEKTVRERVLLNLKNKRRKNNGRQEEHLA